MIIVFMFFFKNQLGIITCNPFLNLVTNGDFNHPRLVKWQWSKWFAPFVARSCAGEYGRFSAKIETFIELDDGNI